MLKTLVITVFTGFLIFAQQPNDFNNKYVLAQSYLQGGQRTVAAVMLPALYTDNHRFTADHTPGELLRTAYAYDRDWYYPVAITAYRDGGRIRHAVSWGWDDVPR